MMALTYCASGSPAMLPAALGGYAGSSSIASPAPLQEARKRRKEEAEEGGPYRRQQRRKPNGID